MTINKGSISEHGEDLELTLCEEDPFEVDIPTYDQHPDCKRTVKVEVLIDGLKSAATWIKTNEQE